MTNKAWVLLAVILLAGLIVGLYAGYKVGFAIRDYRAAQEKIVMDEVLRGINSELGELLLKLAVVNADIEGITRGAKKQLGIGGGPRPSEGDKP